VPLKRSEAMTQKKRINPPGTDAEPDRSLGTDGGDSHIPASESDRSAAATQASREGDTHLPASESEQLASSDTGERILERGLTRLPPG